MGEERPARRPDPSRSPDPDLQEVGDTMSHAFRLLQAPPTPHDGPPTAAHRMYTDRDSVGEDLLKLVLTLVELLRQLIERQALRRVDAGDLTDEQEEELGATLLALHDRLSDLCAEHGYALEDLNLDLGPLGPLLPPRT
ncbi:MULTISPECIES: gas vesicle protein K [unclassified Streptomyces]|uniref:gas vesicle protein K n=1 Tax=unclassified Streptomyces TaxID=2593676 RepID=UPI00109EAB33|nr:gas vesicle protein K [Streptomyces sp. A1136]THA58231.1 gas vesicle protein K [Streptomyces sp. A1136]